MKYKIDVDDPGSDLVEVTHIYCDVDETLIEEHDKEMIDGSIEKVDIIDMDLVDALKWANSIGIGVTVWTGGGTDYARLWRDRAGLTDFADFQHKDPGVVHRTDVVIDDEEFKCAADLVLTATQFVMYAKHERSD